jgi:hypothetical protein
MPSQVLVIWFSKVPWFQAKPESSRKQLAAFCAGVHNGGGVVPEVRKIVGIGEQDKVRRAVRVSRNHVQEILLGVIGQRLRHMIGATVRPVEHIEAEELAGFTLELPRYRIGLPGIAVDVEGRRVVEMNAEGSRIAEFGWRSPSRDSRRSRPSAHKCKAWRRRRN